MTDDRMITGFVELRKARDLAEAESLNATKEYEFSYQSNPNSAQTRLLMAKRDEATDKYDRARCALYEAMGDVEYLRKVHARNPWSPPAQSR